MKESPNRQAVTVGLFVSLGVLVLFGGIITVGSISDAFTRKIELNALFDNVGGLQIGDNVWFSGLKVGTVRRLDFDADGDVNVELTIQRRAADHISSHALAKISSDGLIGNRIVVIAQTESGGPRVQPGDTLTGMGSVSIDAMKETLQRNNTNLLSITEDLRGVTARIAAGEGTAGRLLVDEELYSQARDTLASLQAASASVATFSGQLNEPGHLPHDLVNDQQLYAKLSASAEDLARASANANQLSTALQQGATDPNSAVGTLVADPKAAADLKQTLANLNEGSRLLSEDLDALQHNFLLKGYFRKKDREPPPSN